MENISPTISLPFSSLQVSLQSKTNLQNELLTTVTKRKIKVNTLRMGRKKVAAGINSCDRGIEDSFLMTGRGLLFLSANGFNTQIS